MDTLKSNVSKGQLRALLRLQMATMKGILLAFDLLQKTWKLVTIETEVAVGQSPENVATEIINAWLKG